MTQISWSDRTIKSHVGERLVLSETGPERPAGIAVMFAGFTSRRLNSTNTKLAQRLVPRGIACAACDLSGHGDSDGEIVDQTILKAAQEISTFVGDIASRHGARRVSVLGNSFSANAAIVAAARDGRIGALALKSPVTDYVLMRSEQLGAERMEKWRSEGSVVLDDGTPSTYQFVTDAASVDTYKLLEGLTIPVLAIQGGQDEQIPRASRDRLAGVMKRPGMRYILLDGADHNLSDPYFSRVIDEFESFLGTATLALD